MRTDKETYSLWFDPFPEAVATERSYQNRKWGGERHDREHSLPDWWIILSREVGEVANEVGNVHWRKGMKGHLRAELIQVSAVCATMVEVLDGQE